MYVDLYEVYIDDIRSITLQQYILCFSFTEVDNRNNTLANLLNINTTKVIY